MTCATPLVSRRFDPQAGRRSLTAAGLLMVLSACTEYDLNRDHDVPDDQKWADTAPPDSDEPEPVETAQPQDTDPPVDEDSCDDQIFPASPLEQVDACTAEVETGTFTPITEWSKSTWSVDPQSYNVMMSPIVVSLTDDDGDGDIDVSDTPDIVLITYNEHAPCGTLRAVSGADGAEIFNVTGNNLQGTGGVAAGDIDGDGVVEIVAATQSGVAAFEHDGTLKWTRSGLSGSIDGTSDSPAISDMDGDGSPEIIIGSAILTAAGTIRGQGRYGKAGVSTNVGTVAVAVDLDRDGVEELVTGNAAYDPDGNTIWNNGLDDGYVAVGNFDSDPQGEIVVSGQAQVRLQDSDGSLMWRANIPGASNPYYGGMPTVADYDGDGQPEIGVAANNSYTVFDTDGSVLWQSVTRDVSSGNTGSAVFDFEGDGVAEAVYADETRLWVFAGPDGSVKLESSDHRSNTWTEYAVIADVDADGHAEVVVPNNRSGGGMVSGLSVIGDADNSWREGRRIWNQHAYHITNVNDDGSIPAVADINWDSYNNFRSGDLSAAEPELDPDLVATVTDVSADWCDTGTLWVWVQVGNQGHADVGEVEVSLWADTPTGREHMGTETVSSVPAGWMSESVQFAIGGLTSLDIQDLIATVDGGNYAPDNGAWPECDEANNEGSWGDAVCQ